MSIVLSVVSACFIELGNILLHTVRFNLTLYILFIKLKYGNAQAVFHECEIHGTKDEENFRRRGTQSSRDIIVPVSRQEFLEKKKKKRGGTDQWTTFL